jgi:hypothetical protein
MNRSAPWALYFSDEGFPYYYNHETEESEWAPAPNYSSALGANHPHDSASNLVAAHPNDDEVNPLQNDDDSECSAECASYSTSSSGSGSESSDFSDDDVDLEAQREIPNDPGFEGKVRAFLKTTKGMEMALV